MPARKTKHEHSAGGVVVRNRDVIVIVPRGRSTLALPKGHIDPGETPQEAATREVREETGVVAECIAELGDVKYWYSHKRTRISKVVDFFLFEYSSGSVTDHDHEVEEALWIPIEQARSELTFPGEREMIERAITRLAKREYKR